MTDSGPSMTRRECCRAGLRLLGLAGLLAGGFSLVHGRGEGAARGLPCSNAAGCPRCPLRRACPANRGSTPVAAQAEGRQ
jgi:hypothetical protein